VILTDDHSRDDTATIARSLGIHTLEHALNRGYGGNQKTCYAAALARGADIVVMLHPDYQYTPKLVTAMASMIASDQYDVVLARDSSAAARWRAECPFTNTYSIGCSH
jgi:glycosyltransferase involved in cell wall biosynthesis